MGVTSTAQLLAQYGWPALVSVMFLGVIVPMAMYIKHLHAESIQDARENMRILEGLKHTVDTMVKTVDKL